MKFLTKIYYTFSLFLVSPVYAEEPPRLEVELSPLVDRILGYLFPIAGLIALVFIIQGGYMWIISAGDPSRVKQAQGTLTWAIIGLVVVLVIFALLRILIKFAS